MRFTSTAEVWNWHLHPLSSQKRQKFFAKVELETLKNNKQWLSKATLAVTLYWQHRNARKTNHKES